MKLFNICLLVLAVVAKNAGGSSASTELKIRTARSPANYPGPAPAPPYPGRGLQPSYPSQGSNTRQRPRRPYQQGRPQQGRPVTRQPPQGNANQRPRSPPKGGSVLIYQAPHSPPKEYRMPEAYPPGSPYNPIVNTKPPLPYTRGGKSIWGVHAAPAPTYTIEYPRPADGRGPPPQYGGNPGPNRSYPPPPPPPMSPPRVGPNYPVPVKPAPVAHPNVGPQAPPYVVNPVPAVPSYPGPPRPA